MLEEVPLEGVLDGAEGVALAVAGFDLGGGTSPQVERSAGADRYDVEEQVAELFAKIVDELDALVVVEGVDLVEHAEDLAAVGAQALERAALRGRAAAGGREDPDDRVGLVDELAGHAFMKSVEGVEAGGIDDGGVAEAQARALDLHVADPAGLEVVELLQEAVHLIARDGGDRSVAVVDAGAAAGSAAKQVDRGGRGQHAHRRDGLAEQGVDEGALAGGELAHDRDRQRTGEALAGRDHAGEGLLHAAQWDAEDPPRHRGEQGGGGGQQIFEAVALDRTGEVDEQGAGVLVLGELGEDLDEILLRGLGEAALQAQLGGGEGALAAEHGQAQTDVAQRGDLVGAPWAAEIGLGAEAWRGAGDEVLHDQLVALLHALAGIHQAQFFRGCEAVAQVLADRGDGGLRE